MRGCKDCPQPAATNVVGNVHILYTGGPQHAQYVVARQAIPSRNPDIATKYGWPTVHDDGSIEYSEGEALPPLEGFEVTGRVLRPRWPFCHWKMLRVSMADTGWLTIDALCCNPLSGKAMMKPLLLADCQSCPRRPTSGAKPTAARPSQCSRCLAELNC